MEISFHKQQMGPASGVAFCWEFIIEAEPSVALSDLFIPELFFDFFFVHTGQLRGSDPVSQTEWILPRQSLKTLHTRALTLTFTTPLRLFGARLPLQFGELFWEDAIGPNTFLAQQWVDPDVADLAVFAEQVVRVVNGRARQKNPYPLLKDGLEESTWLSSYSPRHKRRLYKATFGLSRQALQRIANLHAFLAQNCDFDPDSPRLIGYVNAELFYDQPHFNHAFKKMVALTPLEYFEASSVLQDNLMAVSYNALPAQDD
ncbi:MAG: hypothetical protein IPM53_16280 [Anaerolineaceae bacterium]|nr:hypothetical protein [Anaerolineaceae bacterium]